MTEDSFLSRYRAALAVGAAVLIGGVIVLAATVGGPAPSPELSSPEPTVARQPAAPSASALPSAVPAGYVPDPVTRTSGCAYGHASNGAVLPDHACTPGAVDSRLTSTVLCAPGFRTQPYRDGPLAVPAPVTQPVKDAAYARYAVVSHPSGAYEVDHLIPIEVGGSDSPANLWPQPADPTPGFHEKDQVENLVHQRVCSGTLRLAEGQRALATDWTQLLAAAQGVRLPQKQHIDDMESD